MAGRPARDGFPAPPPTTGGSRTPPHWQVALHMARLSRVTVDAGKNRSIPVAYPYVVRVLKLVIVYHGTHWTDYRYAAVEHFLNELWQYCHNSYSPLRHRKKVTTVAKIRRFCNG